MADFLKMTRKQLQALCKKRGVPANLKNAEMAARLSSLTKDEEAQAGSGGGLGELESLKVDAKKKVRFSLENDVYEFVDTYTEGVAKEQAEVRRDGASRRRGLRKNGRTKADKVNAVETAICESEEIFSNQVRLTRSRKSVVIVSPLLRKRAKKVASETGEKESCSNFNVVDSVQTNAREVKEPDEQLVATKEETLGRISTFAEVNSLNSESVVEIKSAAEVPRRTHSQRKFEGDDTSIMGSDDATRPLIKHDLLTPDSDRVQDEAPLRKSSRVVMKNVSNIPENQKRRSAVVLQKQEKKRLKNEFPIVISDSDASITLAREEEVNAIQIREGHILAKPLTRSQLSTSTSTTVPDLDVDSSKENQRACGSLEVELPQVKPLRRSRHYSYDALGLSDVNFLPSDSDHISSPLKQISTNEAECFHEAIASNVTRNCSKTDLLAAPRCLPKKLDCEKRLQKQRKRLARSGKGVSKSIKSYPGENDILNVTDVSESKVMSSDGFLSITEVVRDGICSAKTMTLSDSKIRDEFVEASALSSETLLVKETAIRTVAEASVTDLTKSLSVPAVGKSQITASDSAVLQRETVTADPAQRGLEFEERDNLLKFSSSFSYDMPHGGCTGDELSVEVGEKYALFDDKHDCDISLSSETIISKGVPDQDVTKMEESVTVLYDSPTEGKDAHGITNDWPITGEVVSKEDTFKKIRSNMLMKQNVVDGEYKEISNGDAEPSTEARLTFQNVESLNTNKTTEEKKRIATDESHSSVYMHGSEVVKNLYCDIKIDETASNNHSLANEQGQCSHICNTYDAEGKSDGNWEQNLEFVSSTPEHGLTYNELYCDMRSTERVSHAQANSCKLDERPNICEHIDTEEEVKVLHRIEEVDLTVDVITRMDDNISEAEGLSIEARSVSSQKESIIPELGGIQPYYAPGDSDNAEESSADFLNCHDAEILLTRTDIETVSRLEYNAKAEIGERTSVDIDACEEYGLKNCTDSKETIIRIDTQGMAREGTSYAEFHSFDKLDELLREIDDYFEWRNSEEKVLEGSAMGSDTKELFLNSNVETYFEVAIRTDYGSNFCVNECKCIAGLDVEVVAAPWEEHGEQINEVANFHVNECKCIAGLDVEVVAAPWEEHGEQINEVAAYEHVDNLIIKDDQVDRQEDILEERWSEEHGLPSYRMGRTSVKSPDVIQTSPYQSVTCSGLKAICSDKETLEIDSHQPVKGVCVEKRFSIKENTVLSQGVLQFKEGAANATGDVIVNDSIVFNNTSCRYVSNEASDGNPQIHETDTYFFDTAARAGQAVQDGNSFMPVLPHESTAGLLSNIGVNVLAIEKDVPYSDERTTVNSVNDENEYEGLMEVPNARILSSSNCEEPTSFATHSLNKIGETAKQKEMEKVMKENVTPFSKTESMKGPKSATIKRRRVLDNIQNN